MSARVDACRRSRHDSTSRFAAVAAGVSFVVLLDGCASAPTSVPMTTPKSASIPAPMLSFGTTPARDPLDRRFGPSVETETEAAPLDNLGEHAEPVAEDGPASAREPVEKPQDPAPAVPVPFGPEPPPAPYGPEVPPGLLDPYPIHGSLTSIYRGRFSGSDKDHDVTEILSLDFGDPARNAWTGHVMTRANVDLDGRPGDASPFNDINDTYDAAVVPHLYDAWMQKTDVGALDHLRIGRQTLWDTPVFAWFDGLAAETKPTHSYDMIFGLYGGIPVHLYESSRTGDLMAGAYAHGAPWKDGRVRIDWMHLEDETSVASHSDDLWRASAWQSFGENLRVDGWFSGLNGEERDFMARATWTQAEADLTVSASWFELLTTQQDLSLELDPYFTILGELFPYHQGRLLASKGFGQHVNVQAGVDVRDVSDQDDEGDFNRDTSRVFGTVTLFEVIPGHIDISLTGERWEGDGSGIDTWGVDLSRRWDKKFVASVGSYYALYEFDSFDQEEREDVRTGYLRLRWHRTASTTWDARYDIEDAADRTYQTLRVGLTWTF